MRADTTNRMPLREIDADVGMVVPERYLQLRPLAWNRAPAQPIAGDVALATYERGWWHVDVESLTPRDRDLIARVV